MKLEIKKIEKKVELDTKVEGCLSDCWDGKSYKYSGYNKGIYDEGLGCTKKRRQQLKNVGFGKIKTNCKYSY